MALKGKVKDTASGRIAFCSLCEDVVGAFPKDGGGYECGNHGAGEPPNPNRRLKGQPWTKTKQHKLVLFRPHDPEDRKDSWLAFCRGCQEIVLYVQAAPGRYRCKGPAWPEKVHTGA